MDKFIEKELPKSLSKKEYIGYLQRYRDGDVMARNILIEHGLEFVYKRVCKMGSDFPYDLDDLFSAGTIGLINAIDKFDFACSNSFELYLYKSVDNAIAKYLQKLNAYRNPAVENYSYLSEIDASVIDSVDMVYNYEKKEYIEDILRVVDTFSDRDKKIFLLFFGFADGRSYNQRELSEMFGVSVSVIKSVIRLGRKKINAYFSTEEVKPKRKLLK